jgi:hypothetical protein
MGRNLKKITFNSYLKQSVPVFLAIVVILIIEFAGINRFFTLGVLSDQQPTVLEFDDAALFNFTYEDDLLVADDRSPRIIFTDLNREVAFIDINCIPLSPNNKSTIYFSTQDDPFSEDNSIRFALTSGNNVVVLPPRIFVEDLRLDLATNTGEMLECDNIVLNPNIGMQTNNLRYLVYVAVLALAVWSTLAGGIDGWNRWLNKWGKWASLFYALVIAFIFFHFSLVFTFDSGHYLWLSDIIKQGDFSQWDIIRNLVFPLHLYISNSIFSASTIGLKIPMLFYYLIFLSALYLLILLAGNCHSGKSKFWVATALFVFIALDATIFGYFHAVLTEYMAVTFAAVACLLGFKLYNSRIYSKEFWLLNLALIIISLLGWHIKQPYLGIGLFPHAIAYLLMLTRQPSVKAWLIGVGIAVFILVSAIGSTMGWEQFLARRGNELDTTRHFSTWFAKYLSKQYDAPPGGDNQGLVKEIVKKYLTSSNFFYFDRSRGRMVNSPSFSRAAQNRAIAQNIYRTGRINIVGTQFENVVDPYIEVNSPPEVVDNIFQSRITFSNLLFIIGYLSLPLCLIGYLIWFIIKKDPLSVAALILSGSAAGNGIIHILMGAAPLDRYFFWGFPLILASWILVFLFIYKTIKVKFHSQGKINGIMSSIEETK